jgi:prophage tail gpP-like protein
LLVLSDGQTTLSAARTRAIWEKTVRAGRAIAASITVQGWRQTPTGSLWQINQLVDVFAPWLQIEGQMLISAVSFSKSLQGTLTTLTLSSPDAYRSEPVKQKKRKKASDTTGNPWESS